jgi:hypothetical protein
MGESPDVPSLGQGDDVQHPGAHGERSQEVVMESDCTAVIPRGRRGLDLPVPPSFLGWTCHASGERVDE